MTKLLDALRSRYKTPEDAIVALGLPASVLSVSERYTLAQDASHVVHRASGQQIDKVTFMKHLFEKENPMVQSRLARLARDQGPTHQMRMPGDQVTLRGMSGQPKTRVGDQDPDNGGAAAPDADEMIQFVQLLLAKAPDKEEFLNKLAELVSDASSGAGAIGAVGGSDQGVLPNNKSALDRRRGANDRRPALDSNVRALNHANFLKRHSYLNVDVWR